MKARNPKIVGITGGIGSGKTTVAQFFKDFGIPVYHSDSEAKALMLRSKIIRRRLVALFGKQAYVDDTLNKDYLSKKIFNDKSLLDKMNAIIHPKVGEHFKRWLKKQNTTYILKEVAIIFEHNFENQYDYIITVVAEENERIKRVIKRDGKSQSEVKAIINNQLPDEIKIKKSDFVIYNDELIEAELQAKAIHNKLISEFSKL